MAENRRGTLRAMFLLATLLVLTLGAAAERETALDRYVRQPDAVFAWRLVASLPGAGCTTFVLELKSQSWRSAAEVDRSVWTHWLAVTRPDRLAHSTGLLFIGGGSNRDAAPTAETCIRLRSR